ncbi:MAG: S9 family peptidase [Caldilinea sp.]
MTAFSTAPLIPRRLFFGNPDRTAVQLSPDGAWLGYLAPRDGVLNVWLAPRDDLAAARPVTQDEGRGVRFFLWAYTNRHILYIQDKNGDENWRLYSVDVTTNAIKDLTPFEGVQTQLKHASHLRPDEVIIGLNRRDAQWHDLYRVNVVTGELALIEENHQFMDYLFDDEHRRRLAFQMTAAGGLDVFQYANDSWRPWSSIAAEDMLTTGPVGFDQQGATLFWKDSRGSNTSALVAQDMTSGATRLLAEDPLADVQDVLLHPTAKHVQAVSFVYERKRWQMLDPAFAAELMRLSKVADGEIEIASRTLDDRFWVVRYGVDDGPARFYLYAREPQTTRFLFTERQDLEGLSLASMRSALIPARDALNLVSYYTLPVGSDSNDDGIPDQPLPLVLMPHGGPWGRDFWGYNPWHQWLANRGYAVLSVNFRASTGLGKAFTNAGDHEWGGKIIEDQIDAVQWMVAQGIAAADQVAILGGSFGGYSVLAGLTFYPETYACGVDIVGPSNLITLLESVPPYWKPMIELFTTRVGDPNTEEGRRLLMQHSPLTHVERIRRPLLIGQGANDPRVKQAESDQIVAAMQARQIPVTYVLYPDEGHGFARPENWLSFNAIVEAFLAEFLGGRFEPVGGDFGGASLQVLTGAATAPGLSAALAAQG